MKIGAVVECFRLDFKEAAKAAKAGSSMRI